MRPPFPRVISRLTALARLGLPPELLVPEMSIVVGRALKTITYPAVFAIPAATALARPQDFTVWLGADKMVGEIRQSLALGIWPGPRDTPSLHTIMAKRDNRSAFAATLWGEGCIDEGPWGGMWRDRGLQQGLQTVWFAPSGLTVVAVMAREAGAAPFSAADIAFAEAAAPVITGVIDASPSGDQYDSSVPEAQLVLSETGKPGPMGFRVAEMLRDMGGGGPGALEGVLGRIEQLASVIDPGPAYGVLGDPFVHIRHEIIRAAPSRGVRLQHDIPFGQNAFGRYSVRFSPLARSRETGAGLIAAIRRQVPLALLAVRGALAAGVPARELELAVGLVRGQTLEAAAAKLGIGLTSARTLLNRLLVRLEAVSRRQALNSLVERGREISW